MLAGCSCAGVYFVGIASVDVAERRWAGLCGWLAQFQFVGDYRSYGSGLSECWYFMVSSNIGSSVIRNQLMCMFSNFVCSIGWEVPVGGSW